MTREQRIFKLAVSHVKAVAALPEATYKIYGGLCHRVPVMILTCGLQQTLAFIDAKSIGTDDRANAYRAIRSHLTVILQQSQMGIVINEGQVLSEVVAILPTEKYAMATRLLRPALVFYKRFAVSILKVDDSISADEGGKD